jgi:hypothetical protein
VPSHSNKTERHCIFTSHFGQDVSYLNFPSKSKGTGGPTARPPRSHDIPTLDFFLLGHAEDPVYVPSLLHTSITLMLQIDARMRLQ